MPRQRRPSFASVRFANVLTQAGRQIADGLQRAALVSEHHGTSGAIRETGLREFLRKLLPDRYYVGTGFAFDALDTQTRQLDVVIAIEPPLARVFETDGICYLPCEVVLAVIEVKKTLSSDEVRRSLQNAASVRSLRPYGTQAFTSARRHGAQLERREHRCFYSVVAFDSDLVLDDWAQREWHRFKGLAAASDLGPDIIDRMVILDRGLINTMDGLAQDGAAAVEPIIGQWFIHLSNHLDREAGRRPLFDPDIYTIRRRPDRLE